jgi:hypothetical protein
MTTLGNIFPDLPPELPPPDLADRKAGTPQHGGDGADEATTVTLQATRVLAALDLRQHAQRDVPDMAYTADWLAGGSGPLHDIIEQHEHNEERDERVISRLLDRIGEDAITISDLLFRIEDQDRQIARERKRAERLAWIIARGNSTLIPTGTNE